MHQAGLDVPDRQVHERALPDRSSRKTSVFTKNPISPSVSTWSRPATGSHQDVFLLGVPIKQNLEPANCTMKEVAWQRIANAVNSLHEVAGYRHYGNGALECLRRGPRNIGWQLEESRALPVCSSNRQAAAGLCPCETIRDATRRSRHIESAGAARTILDPRKSL